MSILAAISPPGPAIYMSATRQGVHWKPRIGGTARPSLDGCAAAYNRSVILGASGDALELELATATCNSITGDGAIAALNVGTGDAGLELAAKTIGAAANSIALAIAAPVTNTYLTAASASGTHLSVHTAAKARMIVTGTLTDMETPPNPIVFPPLLYGGKNGDEETWCDDPDDRTYEVYGSAATGYWTLIYRGSTPAANWTSGGDSASPDLEDWTGTGGNNSSGTPVITAAPSSALQAGDALAALPAAAALLDINLAGDGSSSILAAASAHLTGGIDVSVISGIDGCDYEGRPVALTGLRSLHISCSSGAAQLVCGDISIPIPAGSDLDIRMAEPLPEWLAHPLGLTATANATALEILVSGEA